MATVTVRNGINVDQLMATIGAIEQDSQLAPMTFKASTRWQEGTRSSPARSQIAIEVIS